MRRVVPTALRSWLQRHWLSLVLAALTVLIVFSVATARLFVWPSTDHVDHVDAIVLFAGGRGERLALAERLMDAGIARNLVIPNGQAAGWPEGNRACTEARRYAVRCLRPDPDTTIGEARAIAALARDESWDRVLIVTSSYQLARAGLLLGRCFDGDVLTTRAQPDLGLLAWASRVGHEWIAWSWAGVVARAC
jgi:uncharacterized SAM-binding protein YcdF (DUF218 family)